MFSGFFYSQTHGIGATHLPQATAIINDSRTWTFTKQFDGASCFKSTIYLDRFDIFRKSYGAVGIMSEQVRVNKMIHYRAGVFFRASSCKKDVTTDLM
jgi:hypothetical protein